MFLFTKYLSDVHLKVTPVIERSKVTDKFRCIGMINHVRLSWYTTVKREDNTTETRHETPRFR